MKLEPEAWVAFDGLIDLNDEGGIELATRLADQYWNMEDERLRSVLTAWQQAPDDRKQHDPQWWVPLCFDKGGEIQNLTAVKQWRLQ